MARGGLGAYPRRMQPFEEQAHRKLCTIELIAEGHAERCPGEECLFWVNGCVLERVEGELDARPEVAALLLDLRRELEQGSVLRVDEVTDRLREIPIDPSPEAGPAGPATELV
jgi:hypothetical protein